ncbi:glycerophosphoryl diester phosphodiesterase membrane domain-containing protein [Kineococcus sp. SYSU DK004]|uniref:glycerophosphoryl diester phosphodiesterase membrane domain-containing protein n=1 Tax=Kineococcus sp. SYSU DK004 TaxID=3383125 RepID=UPI003D7CEE0B
MSQGQEPGVPGPGDGGGWHSPAERGAGGWHGPADPPPPGPAPVAPPGAAPGAPGGQGGQGGPGGWDGGGWQPPPAQPAPPRPGIVPLRPLGLGEIWDGAFRAFRLNPRAMVGLSALVVGVTTVVIVLANVVLTRDVVGLAAQLETGAAGPAEALGALQRSVPLFLVSTLLQVVAVLVLNGMLILAVSRAVLGQRTGLAELWRLTRPRVLALVAVSLLVTVAVLVLGALLLAPGIALLATDTSVGAGALALVGGLLAWLVLGAFVYVRWALATPALLLERLGVGASLGRSWRLVRGSWWRTFGILALTSVVATVVVTAVQAPFSLLSGAATFLGSGGQEVPGTTEIVVSQTVTGIGTLLGSVVAYPFLASVTALVYVDLRMRREGLDVELHRAAAAGPGGDGRDPAA